MRYLFLIALMCLALPAIAAPCPAFEDAMADIEAVLDAAQVRQ